MCALTVLPALFLLILHTVAERIVICSYGCTDCTQVAVQRANVAWLQDQQHLSSTVPDFAYFDTGLQPDHLLVVNQLAGNQAFDCRYSACNFPINIMDVQVTPIAGFSYTYHATGALGVAIGSRNYGAPNIVFEARYNGFISDVKPRITYLECGNRASDYIAAIDRISRKDQNHIIVGSSSNLIGNFALQLGNIVDNLFNNGKLLIISAGNHGPTERSVGYPAQFSKVIAVGAEYLDGTPYPEQSIGPSSTGRTKPDLQMSHGICGAYTPFDRDMGVKGLAGTSYASPMATAVASMMANYLQNVYPHYLPTGKLNGIIAAWLILGGDNTAYNQNNQTLNNRVGAGMFNLQEPVLNSNQLYADYKFGFFEGTPSVPIPLFSLSYHGSGVLSVAVWTALGDEMTVRYIMTVWKFVAGEDPSLIGTCYVDYSVWQKVEIPVQSIRDGVSYGFRIYDRNGLVTDIVGYYAAFLSVKLSS